MSTFWKIALAAAILVALRLSIFTVDASEYAYVTILGRHVATHDGYDGGAGLYIGWPWPIQVVQRLDRRIQQFDLPSVEALTRDVENKVDKNLAVEAYVVWRIKDQDQEAVNKFVTRIGTEAKVRLILAPRIVSKLLALIGQMRMDDIINTNSAIVEGKMRDLHDRILNSLKEQVLQEYGIDLIDVRLRRFNYPRETSQAIFDRIKAERQKKAADYRTEGELEAQKIKSKAEEESRIRVAQAELEESLLKAKAAAETMRLLNEATSHDPKFYEFLKEMDKLQSILSNNRTVLLLSTHRPLFQRLFHPPQPGMSDVPANKGGK
jgi:membrane protease subunit HflC